MAVRNLVKLLLFINIFLIITSVSAVDSWSAARDKGAKGKKERVSSRPVAEAGGGRLPRSKDARKIVENIFDNEIGRVSLPPKRISSFLDVIFPGNTCALIKICDIETLQEIGMPSVYELTRLIDCQELVAIHGDQHPKSSSLRIQIVTVGQISLCAMDYILNQPSVVICPWVGDDIEEPPVATFMNRYEQVFDLDADEFQVFLKSRGIFEWIEKCIDVKSDDSHCDCQEFSRLVLTFPPEVSPGQWVRNLAAGGNGS